MCVLYVNKGSVVSKINKQTNINIATDPQLTISKNRTVKTLKLFSGVTGVTGVTGVSGVTGRAGGA